MSVPKLMLPEVSSSDDDSFLHFYDEYPTRDDLMGESPAQAYLITYLMAVLRWHYWHENWFIITNLNLYKRKIRHEQPLAPDVALFKGVVVKDHTARSMRSWRLYEPGRPPPQVVFEFASHTTWREDVEDKPEQYAKLDVQEYYAYDPNNPPYFPKRMGRLRGWRLVNGVMVERQPDERGWLWSAELDSWLVPDNGYLRLYDADGKLRLTRDEAETIARQQAEIARKAERLARDREQKARQQAEATAAAERAATEAERAAKEAAWAKLRELGIDPEKL